MTGTVSGGGGGKEAIDNHQHQHQHHHHHHQTIFAAQLERDDDKEVKQRAAPAAGHVLPRTRNTDCTKRRF